MKLILHSYRRCPFCIRTRIVLQRKNIPYEVVEEPLRKWTPWFRAHVEEPRSVPVLRAIDDNGNETIMRESNDINLWLDVNCGEIEFTPEKGGKEHEEMEKWWSWCAGDFKKMLDLWKYGEDRNFDRNANVEHTQQLAAHIQKLEDTLTQKPYLLGEKLTLADIAIIPFMRQIMRTRVTDDKEKKWGEFDFSSFPHVERWTNDVIETDWFKDEVMKKVPAAPSDSQ